MLTDFKPYSLFSGIKSIEIQHPWVMGILNTTEDSFFDGGKYHTIQAALKRCELMISEGVDIIDIGGQSTQPGAIIKSIDEEIQATVPIVEAVRKTFPEVLLSIDTFRAEVAKQCIDKGAHMVNDISSGDDDPHMLSTVAQLNVPYIAMHKKGTPENMQQNARYEDVCLEVNDYFEKKIRIFQEIGIREVILDPGFGFGKTIDHNYQLLNQLDDFHQHQLPLLIGISRKSMVWKTLNISPEEALNGSTALHTLALLKGAHILRVHDVKEAKECIKIIERLRKNNKK
jgi:dihydropteroate synthase